MKNLTVAFVWLCQMISTVWRGFFYYILIVSQFPLDTLPSLPASVCSQWALNLAWPSFAKRSRRIYESIYSFAYYKRCELGRLKSVLPKTPSFFFFFFWRWRVKLVGWKTLKGLLKRNRAVESKRGREDTKFKRTTLKIWSHFDVSWRPSHMARCRLILLSQTFLNGLSPRLLNAISFPFSQRESDPRASLTQGFN